MNDSAAAAQFLTELNLPYRSAVSLDTQTIEAWSDSGTGLNPDTSRNANRDSGDRWGYGTIHLRRHSFRGTRAELALADRCSRFAKRLKRWNNLRTMPRNQVPTCACAFLFSSEQREHRHCS